MKCEFSADKQAATVSYDSGKRAKYVAVGVGHAGNVHYMQQSTPASLREVLLQAAAKRTKVRIHLGYTTAEHAERSGGKELLGRDWLEEHDCEGYLAWTSGPLSVLGLAERTADGLSALLEDCVVRVRSLGKKGGDLWRHGSYHVGRVELDRTPVVVDGVAYGATVSVGGQVHARFRTVAEAQRWADKFGGLMPRLS